MTDKLRALAEAEAEQKYRFPVVYNREFEMQAQRREAYVEGFIAGRTSVTREQIAEVIASSGAYGFKWEQVRPMTRDAYLAAADAVLALMAGLAGGEGA